ncbi:MAG TPA: response regulator [Candidatus Saccharimonadales bacterium]
MKKVLLVEDDLPYRKIYTLKFEASGYQVDTAADGLEALAKLKSNLPDIALVDLLMPKMDGFQLIDKVKKDPKLCKIPIVVLTNLATADDAQKVIREGVEDVLVKSNVEPNAIVARVDEILAMHAGSDKG